MPGKGDKVWRKKAGADSALREFKQPHGGVWRPILFRPQGEMKQPEMKA